MQINQLWASGVVSNGDYQPINDLGFVLVIHSRNKSESAGCTLKVCNKLKICKSC